MASISVSLEQNLSLSNIVAIHLSFFSISVNIISNSLFVKYPLFIKFYMLTEFNLPTFRFTFSKFRH